MRTAAVAFAILALAGCAAHGAVAVDTPKAPVQVCVPPSMAPVDEWKVMEADSTVMVDAIGRPLMILKVAYVYKGAQIMSYWLNGSLMVVDTDSADKEAPVWYDAGMAERGRGINLNPTPTCDWKRFVMDGKTV